MQKLNTDFVVNRKKFWALLVENQKVKRKI